MADIGDKAFTTEMVQEIKRAVMAELGTNAFVKRYLATVSAVNTTTSEVTVYLSGSDITSASFYARGILLPEVGDRVVACIDGADRWIEDVIRPQTATPYVTFATAASVPAGAVMAWLTGTAPTGWLFCDGTSYAYNTYPALGALLGGSAGGNFNVPDMRDRFLGGLSAVGTWANNSGTVGPNTIINNEREHTHTTPIVHGHTASALEHGSHTHPVDVGITTTSQESVVSGSTFAYTVSGAGVTVSYRNHTHTLDPSGDTATANTTGTGDTQHTVSVANNTTADQTSNSVTYTGVDITAKSTRLNFIIKT